MGSWLLWGVGPVSFDEETSDEFARLHKIFTFHLGVAVSLAWMTALYASMVAPWVRNIRPLIDPVNASRVESTWSFLFGLPVVLTLAWVVSLTGRDMLRHFRVLGSQATEFGVAAAVAFAIFYLSIDRAIAAILLSV